MCIRDRYTIQFSNLDWVSAQPLRSTQILVQILRELLARASDPKTVLLLQIKTSELCHFQKGKISDNFITKIKYYLVILRFTCFLFQSKFHYECVMY